MVSALLGVIVLGAVIPLMTANPAGALPPAPTLTAPIDGFATSTNPILQWAPIANAQYYRIQIAKAADFSQNVYDAFTVNTYATPQNDLAQGMLYWRVLAHDATGDSPWSTSRTVQKTKPPAPMLASPLDAGVLTFPTQLTTFTWVPLAGVQAYEIEIANDALFTPPLIASAQTFNPSYTFNNPQPIGQSFYWHVRGLITGGNTTNYSSVWTYSVSWPTVPILTSPANAVDPPIDEVTFKWDPVPGAVSYDLEVSSDVDFGAVVFSINTKSTVYSMTTVLPNASYFWHVRARNTAAGLGAWSNGALTPWLFTKGPPASGGAVPTLLTPTNLQANVIYPTFSWTPIRLADHYRLDVATDVFFTQNVQTCYTDHTTYTPYNGQCDTPFSVLPTVPTYYWRVAGINGPANLPGLFSVTFSFSRAQVSALPAGDPGMTTTLTSPANCRVSCLDVYDTPTFTWNRVTAATSYIVTIAADVNFTNIVGTYTTTYPILTPSESFGDNTAGLAKFWYARPCNGGCGPDAQSFAASNPSPVWSFRKQSTGVAPISPGVAGLVPSPGVPGPPVAYPYADQITFKWTDYLDTNQTLTPKVNQEARQYRVQVFTAADLSQLVDDSQLIEQTTYTPPNSTYPEGPLWWRVQATDGTGNPMTWSPVWSFIKASPPLVLISPAAGATVNYTVPFVWTAQNAAYSYEVQVYSNPDQPLADVNKVIDQNANIASVSPNVTLPPGNYGWRVRRFDADNRAGPWSAQTNALLRLFTVTGIPTILLTPANDASSPGNSLLFTWTAVGAATQYRIETSASPSFSPLNETITTVMTAWAPQISYSPNTTFYWRVLTLDAFGTKSSTSNVFSFGPHLATAPTAVSAVPANTMAIVSWTPPASNGGSAITSYLITASPGGITANVPVGTSGGINGLTNGTSYTFTVAAINAAGTGPQSNPSNAVIPGSTPDQPTNVSAIPGNGSAQVSWVAPAFNGGNAITGYQITALPNGTQVFVGNVLTINFPGLSNGTSVNFVVAAINQIGTGIDSSPSLDVTPLTIPGAPTSVTGAAGSASAALSWNPPASDGGAPIVNYRIVATPGGAVTMVGSSATSMMVTGLTNGISYTFKVQAINGAGTGPASAASNAVIPKSAPGAPTAVTATAGVASATVSWTAPASNGASTITGYTLTANPGGATKVVSNVLTTNFTGLTNGTAYTFTVRATNAVGTGPASAASNSVTPRTTPGAPTSVAGVPGNTSVNLTWLAPASNGGAAITGYTITAAPGAATMVVGNVVNATFTGLTNGTAYTFTVKATNAAGAGSASAASAAITPRTTPGAPSAVIATVGNTTAGVSWAVPASNGGNAVTGYTITAAPGGATKVVGNVLNATFTGLTNGISYTFTVAATNAAGTGAVSTPSNAVTPILLGASFHAIVPFRMLDSRGLTGGWNAQLSAGAARALTVTNIGGVPTTATAVIMNVTVTGSNAGSFVTLFPAGGAQPNASNLNFGPGQTIPNLVTVKVGSGGQVMFANEVGATDVVADAVGYFDDGVTTGDLFNGVTPSRILDSRGTTGGWNAKLGAGDANAKTLQITGSGVVPVTATAVVMNTTVTGSDTGSFLQVWPTGATRPNSSNLNFAAGQTISNLVTVALGTGGKVSVYNAVGNTDVIADVVGYFDPTGGSRFHPLVSPTRILDDRVNNGLSGSWGPDQSRVLSVTGANGIPAGATGIIMNTTVTGGTTGSFVSVYPDGSPLPISSNINFGPGQTIPNLVMVQLPGNGRVDLYNKLGNVDIIADAIGYYSLT